MPAATERVPVLMTPAEKKKVVSKAKKAGMTTGEYMRRAAEGYRPADDDKALEAMIDEMNKWMLDVHPSTYYRWQRQLRRHGPEILRPRERRTPRMPNAIALADELSADDRVGDATWERLAARWSDAELVELLLVAGMYRLVSGFLNSTGVQLDDGVPGFPR